MRSLADAIRRDDQVVITSSSISSNGLGQFNGWFRVVGTGITDDALGAVIREALEVGEQRDGFDAPELSRNAPDLLTPVYAAVGAADERAFTHGAQCVSYDRADGILYVQPMLNDGKRGGGFVAHGEEIEYPHTPSATDLGRIARAGWDRHDLPDLRTDEAHT